MRALDRAADKLKTLAQRGEHEGGLVGNLAGDLRADADFLRRLKPRLVKARLKGLHPTAHSHPHTPNGPQLARSRQRRSPYPLLGAALGTGVILAKLIDWRSHAHPRN